jgi:hypothetical protein
VQFTLLQAPDSSLEVIVTLKAARVEEKRDSAILAAGGAEGVCFLTHLPHDGKKASAQTPRTNLGVDLSTFLSTQRIAMDSARKMKKGELRLYML